MKLTVVMLHRLLRYDGATGKLYWRERTSDMFDDGRQSAMWRCNNWNSRFADKEAFFTLDSPKKYFCGAIFAQTYLAHRVIWAMVTGDWPADQIDHINQNPADNRIANLRVVSNQENCRNQKLRITNTSGFTGVYWLENGKKWVAKIGVNGNLKHLGYFARKGAAIAALQAANIKYNFHSNHGKRPTL